MQKKKDNFEVEVSTLSNFTLNKKTILSTPPVKPPISAEIINRIPDNKKKKEGQ